jgi:hypothetical protein
VKPAAGGGGYGYGGYLYGGGGWFEYGGGKSVEGAASGRGIDTMEERPTKQRLEVEGYGYRGLPCSGSGSRLPSWA